MWEYVDVTWYRKIDSRVLVALAMPVRVSVVQLPTMQVAADRHNLLHISVRYPLYIRVLHGITLAVISPCVCQRSGFALLAGIIR